MATAQDIMTKSVITILETDTLREAATLLTEKHISGAPVVDETGALVGVLSESDLLSESRRRAALPRVAAFGIFLPSEESLERIYDGGANLLVRDVMTRDVFTAPESISLHELGETMLRRKINRVPIVDDSGALQGIVTREDILKAIYHLKPAAR
jgi:CBS domain-containing protein